MPGGIRDVLDTEDVAHILCQEPRLTVQIDDADALGLDAAVVEEEVGQLLFLMFCPPEKTKPAQRRAMGVLW